MTYDSLRASKRGLRSSGYLAAALLVVCVSGCSVLLDFSTEQCSNDGDCAKKGAAFAGRICDVSTHVCVAGGGAGGGGAGAGGAGGASGCVSNRQCSNDHQQLPYACITAGEPCTALLSKQCTRVVGNFADNDAIFFGLLANFSDMKENVYEQDYVDGTELAVNEITTNAVGLPLGGTGTRRPLVVVECDDNKDIIGATQHLIDDVKVPVILGPNVGDQVLQVAIKEAIPKDVMVMSEGADSPLLKTLDDQGLVWSANQSADQEAIAMTRLIPTFETDLKTLRSETNVKIAVIVKGDNEHLAAVAPFPDNLMFNGASLAQNQANGYYKQFQYDPTVLDYSAVITGVLSFKPDLIIVYADPTEVIDGAVGPIEEMWNAATMPRPVWLLSQITLGYESTNQVKNSQHLLYQREYGTIPQGADGSNPNYDDFSVRFSSQFQNKYPTHLAAIGYDATYLVAFAAVGAGKVPKYDGKAIAGGMAKLVPPGPTISDGPSTIESAFADLIAGSQFDFKGAQFDYDFDLTTGSAPTPDLLICWGPSGYQLDSSFNYEVASDSWTGTYAPCKLPSQW